MLKRYYQDGHFYTFTSAPTLHTGDMVVSQGTLSGATEVTLGTEDRIPTVSWQRDRFSSQWKGEKSIHYYRRKSAPSEWGLLHLHISLRIRKW